MGGLLEKATTTKTEQSEGQTFEPAVVVAASPLPSPQPSSSAPAGGRSPSGSPETAQKIGLAGWVVIIIGAILSLQGGSWGLIVVATVVVLGVAAIVQADRMRGGVSKPKLYATLIIAMLVAVGPYALVVVFPSNANIAVTDISIDEENDELDFAVRGSFDSVDIEIVSDGEILWSGSAEMGENIKRFNIPIAEFFDGNSQDYEGKVLKTYTIKAISSNGNTVEMDVNSKYLTRQAADAGVQFTPYVSTNTADGTSKHEGIRVQAFVGLFSIGEKPMDDGKHSYASANQRQFTGQVTYSLEISRQGSSLVYTHPTVTIDGDVAKWISDFSGSKSSSTAVAFVPLSGTAIDNDGFEYIEANKFFDGDDCYDFTITVTNVNLGSEHSTSFTVVNSWEINWDESDGRDPNQYPTCE